MKLTEEEREAVMRLRGESKRSDLDSPNRETREIQVNEVKDIGVVLFELLTNEDEIETICNNCGWPVTGDNEYCPYCKEGLFWEKRG